MKTLVTITVILALTTACSAVLPPPRLQPQPPVEPRKLAITIEECRPVAPAGCEWTTYNGLSPLVVTILGNVEDTVYFTAVVPGSYEIRVYRMLHTGVLVLPTILDEA